MPTVRDTAAQAADRDPRKDSWNPPRISSRLFSSVLDMQQQTLSAVAGILRNSDEAWREDRVLQEAMLHDPAVQAPLMQRQLAVALLPWSIVPEDEADRVQVAQAQRIERIIRTHLSDSVDMLRCLQEAVFYGPAAVSVTWKAVAGEYVPVAWDPFHPDSLVWDEYGNLGVRVGRTFRGRHGTTPSENGMAYMLDARERAAVVLHTFQRRAPRYERGYDARTIYSGWGLRRTIFYHWLTKQTVLKIWVATLERRGLGVTIGEYVHGDDESRRDVEQALENLTHEVHVSVPRKPGTSPDDPPRIRFLDTPLQGLQVFTDFLKGYLTEQIALAILGQTATSQAVSTGLGSEVATAHRETFHDIGLYDARMLGESLTRDLVTVCNRLNHGDTPWRPRWEFSTEEVDSEEQLKGARHLYDMGVELNANELRQLAGLTKPTGDDPRVARPAFDDGGQGQLPFDLGAIA